MTCLFQVIHGLLDRVMQVLNIPFQQANGYSIEAAEGIVN